jgi:hypothetical protein
MDTSPATRLDSPHAALAAELALLRRDEQYPRLYSFRPDQGRIRLEDAGVLPGEWDRVGILRLLADVTAVIGRDPWRHTTALGYVLALPGERLAYAADRVGGLIAAYYPADPDAPPVTTALPPSGDLAPEASALRTMALAVNGGQPPADPAPRPAARPRPAPWRAPDAVLLGGTPELRDGLKDIADFAGTELQLRDPAAIDVRTWQTATLPLVADEPATLGAVLALPFRPGIVLIGTEPAGPRELRDAANVIGAAHLAIWPKDMSWLERHFRVTAARRGHR